MSQPQQAGIPLERADGPGGLVDVRDPETHRLILQFDRIRGTIHIKHRGTWYIVILGTKQCVSDVLELKEP